MATHQQFVQQFTRLFEHYTQALTFESQHAGTSTSAAAGDEDHRFVAAARLAVLELETDARAKRNARKYFAKPGEAEWGC